MKESLIVCALVLPFIATGCASVTGSPNQSVSVQARELAGVDVVGASCELTNDEGKWFVTTPGSVSIHRSNKDLQVSCKKSGFEPGQAAVASKTKASMFGNILLGGGVGAIIDHNTGSAYEYPTVIDILMGSFTKIETTKNQAKLQNDSQHSMVAAAQITSIQPNEEKLKELKQLHDAGLISKEVYLDRQKEILSRQNKFGIQKRGRCLTLVNSAKILPMGRIVVMQFGGFAKSSPVFLIDFVGFHGQFVKCAANMEL